MRLRTSEGGVRDVDFSDGRVRYLPRIVNGVQLLLRPRAEG